MAVVLDNTVDLDKRLESVQRSYLVDVLAQIRGIVNDPSLVERSLQELKNTLSQVIDIVTAPDLLALTRDRLTDITRQTPDDMIAVANPSVRLLNRGSVVAEDQGPRQVASLLHGATALADYNLGQLLIDMNPYFPPDPDIVSEDQFIQATLAESRAGPLKRFNAFSTWDKTADPEFPHIPHPDEPHPSVPHFQPSWYMVTGRTPKDVPVPVTSLPGDELVRARNVVKVVEVEYGEKIDTGELVSGVPKKKHAHVFFLYAGGNGT